MTITPNRLGIVPCHCAPYHNGHHLLITTAALENDNVIVLLSTSDRKRKNEIPIYWRQMLHIWQQVINKYIPKNVEIRLCNNISPIKLTWELLESYTQNMNDCPTITIYGDPIDNEARFNNTLLVKYVESLYNNNRVKIKSFDRSLTNNISGQMMRFYIANNNKQLFVKNLPFNEQENDLIWKILTTFH